MDKEAFEGLIKTLHEQYKQAAPETHECICRLNLTYNKDDERCRECYAIGKVREDLFRAAIKTGNNQLALLIAFAGIAPSEEEE